MARPPRVLITGATGFVGRHLAGAVAAADYRVRLARRSIGRAGGEVPAHEWVRFDVDEAATVRAALEGCNAACYLVHRIVDGDDAVEREDRAARTFARAAQGAGLERIVYLGGVQPRGRVSAHLRSRLRTGQILRAEFPSTVELRAAMIVGHGSASFEMVRQIAARLPVVAEQDWMLNRSCPVAIDDVVIALLSALPGGGLGAGCYDVTGPERLSHRNLLSRVSALLGKTPRPIRVPHLTPRIAARVVALTTRTPIDSARYLLAGLLSDLVPERGHGVWDRLPPRELRPLDAAILDALEDESSRLVPSRRTTDRLQRLVSGHLGSLGP
jgi:uncharacterized protein YbjT (DUF2867 family)